LLEVLLTCDTEVWCTSWGSLDRDFPEAFSRYIYGRAPSGEAYGLPYQMQTLRDHGLRGVFFVEPLFATHFGLEPLREIVSLVNAAEQEVQLHLHTEWADEAHAPLLPHITEKRQHLRYFSADEQRTLIAAGAALLEAAGAERPTAFRAGSFALNLDTLKALPQCGIHIDSSYSATMMGPTSGIAPGTLLRDVTRIAGVVEYPVSVFVDGFGRLRHAQLGACSFEELQQALIAALEAQQRAFVLVFHNFELLNSSRTGEDAIVVRRFERLCRFLADNRASFRTVGFRDVADPVSSGSGPELRVGRAATARRYIEQATRRLAA
jgi:hypothetical protein